MTKATNSDSTASEVMIEALIAHDLLFHCDISSNVLHRLLSGTEFNDLPILPDDRLYLAQRSSLLKEALANDNLADCSRYFQQWLNRLCSNADLNLEELHDENETLSFTTHRFYRWHDKRQTTGEPCEQFIATVNLQTLKRSLATKALNNALLETGDLAYISETSLLLIHQFVKRRNAFFETYNCLSPQEALRVLDIHKKNDRREIANLIKQHELLVLVKNKKNVIPAFQFNRFGQVYDEIKTLLKFCTQRRVNLFDLVFWLTSEIAAMPVADTCLAVEEGEPPVYFSEKTQNNGQMVKGKPIDLLASGNGLVFEQLAEQWLEVTAR